MPTKELARTFAVAPGTFAELGKLTPDDWAQAKALVRGRAEQEKSQRSAG